MIDPRDPTRLGDIDPLLREAFDQARNDQPSAASVDAVVRGVEQAALGASAAHGDALSSLQAKLVAANSGLVKLAVIVGVSSSLMWAAVHSYRAVVTRATAVQNAAPRVSPDTGAGRLSATSVDRHADSPPAQPSTRSATRLGEYSSVQLPADVGTATRARASSRAEGSVGRSGMATTSEGASRRRAARPKSREPRVDEHEPTRSRAETLPELALLEQAQQALRTSPELALDLTDQHLREYPRGVFAQEREQIAIEALHGAGRIAAMRARARRFQRSFPGSAHNARIAELIGSSPP